MPLSMLMLILLALNPIPAHCDHLLEGLIPALEKATSYFQSNYDKFNLDGILGYQFLKDWINGVLKKWSAEPKIHSQYRQLENIERTVSFVIERSTTHLKNMDKEYFTGFKQLTHDGFWKPLSSWVQSDPLLVYHKFNSTALFDEEFSDKCMRNILGTRKDNRVACSIPSLCRKTMTQFGYSKYILSHQLLYFMIANQKGCTDDLFKVETEVYKNIFCANMMKINQEIERDEYPYLQHDLFLENIMFCGMSGFSDFFKLKWLETILSWQDPETGCFGKSGLLKELHIKSDLGKPHSPRRVKRREQLLADGCLCHMTSAAVGALGGFLSLY